GRQGPVREQDEGLHQGGSAAVDAGRVRRGLADVDPGHRRLRERVRTRRTGNHDDRQRHPVRVPPGPELSGGRGPRLRADGHHAGGCRHLRSGARHDEDHRGMSAVATEPRQEIAPAPVARRPSRRWTRFLLPTYVGAFILYLSFPIFVIILFSFNQTRGGFGTSPRVKTTWIGFTTDWYKRLFELPDLTAALRHSLTIGVLSALAATALGTLLGLALARHRFRGRGGADFVIFLS